MSSLDILSVLPNNWEEKAPSKGSCCGIGLHKKGFDLMKFVILQVQSDMFIPTIL